MKADESSENEAKGSAGDESGLQRLFLYGYYGQRNTGDDALLYAFLLALASTPFEFGITCGEQRPTLPAGIARRVFLIKTAPFDILVNLLRASAFVIAGGNHLADYGRRTSGLVMQGRILVVVTLAKILRKKIHLIAVGVGPFERGLTAFLAKLSLLLADDISVRDLGSLQAVRKLGLTRDVKLSFDISALLSSNGAAHRPRMDADVKVLGMSITPIAGIHHPEEEVNAAFVKSLADALNPWLSSNPDWTLRLFVFHGELRRRVTHDAEATKQLHDQITMAERVSVVDYNADPGAVMKEVSACTAFVGMKFHACLFAYLTGVPLLVVPYHAKCVALAKEIGLPESAVLHPSDVLRGDLRGRLNSLTHSLNSFRSQLPQENAAERAKLAFEPILEACKE